MIELKKEEMYKIEFLFRDMHDTVILSCLQGYMGRAWTDNLDNPKCALIQTGDFSFIAGDEHLIRRSHLIENILDLADSKFTYVIPENKALGNIIEEFYGVECNKIQRYGIKKRLKEFDLDKLQRIVDGLPKEYSINSIHGEWYHKSLEEEWSKDFVSNFLSQTEFKTRGIGFVITHNGKIVSGASSYTVYKEGIEIEIATRKEYRRQNLALVVGAALIIACREKGLYPSWDAANTISVHLAENLGYEYDGPYDTYEICMK